MATTAPYKVNWTTGTEKKLLLVSVGDGGAAKSRLELLADDLWLLDHAKNVPRALMNAASAWWDRACRTVGVCRFGAQIDREIGDMVLAPDTKDPNWTGPKQFTYMRYDPDVSQSGLDALGLDDAAALALLAIEEIGRSRLLHHLWKESVEKGSAFSAQPIRLKCENHVYKQTLGLSSAIRDQERYEIEETV